MSVLVTGGAGFIGSNLVDTLLTEGHEVTVLDNFSEGKLENLKRWKGCERLEVVRGDVKDYDIVRRCTDHKTFVFHLAAMSRIQPSITDPLLAFSLNYMGTANVLEASRLNGVKRVVYSASSSAYGLKNSLPNKENMPTDCLNAYSLSKKGGEELCEMYRSLYGLSTVSLRYFNVYGPRHQEEGSYATVIAIFRRLRRENKKLTIVGDGEQRRDFTFVGDVVRANMLAAMNRDVSGIINIGTGLNYSINDVADLICKTNTKESFYDVEYLPARLAEARLTLADNTRAKIELGWIPLVTLKQGLEVLDLFERMNQKVSKVLTLI